MHMHHPNTYGAAEWADPVEVAIRFKYDPETDFFLGRNPYNFEDAIGRNDDTHVFLCAGTRGGKGRSIVVNNLLEWRGSVVSVDPKGENASICAARRAGGDAYCEGLNQKTYVLDPYRRARVPDELRASCNLMDVLDPNSGSLLSECETLAEALRVTQDGGESESWSKDGAQITALVIAHVKTYPYVRDNDRNLVKVREFLTSGQQDAVSFFKEQNKAELERAEAEGREPVLKRVPDAYEELFNDMLDNPAQGGAISRRARGLLDLMRSNVRQWGSLIQNARTETNFVDDLQMGEQLMGSSHGGRSFSITDLRDDPDGISVFICIPDDPNHPAIRWQKALVTLILEHMRKELGTPKTKKQVLMVLDEFASMGKMPIIANGMTSIAGFGVKLFVIVTQISHLIEHYDKAWKRIPSGCGTQIWFSIDETDTGKYIEELFGDAQVILNARSTNLAIAAGQSTNESVSDSEGSNESESEGKSITESQSSSTSHTKGHSLSMSVSDADTWSHTEGEGSSNTKSRQSGWALSETLGRGKSESSSSNSNYSVNRDGFFSPLVKSTNSARGSGRTSGTNSNRSLTSSRSGSTSESNTLSRNSSDSIGGSRTETRQSGTTESNTNTDTTGQSITISKTYTQGISKQRTVTSGSGKNQSVTLSSGMQESIQKRPLITIPEQNRYLARVDERDHPTYPGFALVRISGTDPFLVRKCYYDQDPIFEGHFTPHYAHERDFLPFSEQRLVGGQYTRDHFIPIRLPELVHESSIRIDVHIRHAVDDWFEAGADLFDWEGPHDRWNTEALRAAQRPIPKIEQDLDASEPHQQATPSIEDRSGSPKLDITTVTAPAIGKVVDVAQSSAFAEDGDIMLVRMERAFDDRDRVALEIAMFSQAIEYLRNRGAAQAEIDKMAAALNQMYRSEWEAHHEELERQARLKLEAEMEAERQRIAAEEEAARLRAEEEERARQQELALQQKLRDDARAENVMVYRLVFLAFFVALPLFNIFWNASDAMFFPERFKVKTHSEWQREWSWIAGDFKCYDARNVKEYGLIKRYSCLNVVDRTYSHARNVLRLIFLSFFWPIIVGFIALMLIKWNYNSDPPTDFYASQSELLEEGVNGSPAWVWKKFGGWTVLIGLLTIACLVIFQLRVMREF